MFRLRRIIWLGLGVFVAIAIAIVTAPTAIVPPANPINPTTVYLLDLGYHARLVLPTGDRGLVQYAYGDWHYFARNQKDFVTSIRALFIPTPGTLGRREFRDVAEIQQTQYDRLLILNVSAAEVAQLVQALNLRFNQNINTEIVNSAIQMNFVRDRQNYSLLHNSNQEVALWVEALGCDVQGLAVVILPNFQV